MADRRTIRPPGYDYTAPGAYFVTLCTAERTRLFEDLRLRAVVAGAWQDLPRHHPHVHLDAWVLMPDHLHGILLLADAAPVPTSQPAGGAADRWPPEAGALRPLSAAGGSLGAILGNLKAVTARRINHLRHTPGAAVWQRNYFERIIRDQDELEATRACIADNPSLM